MKKGGRMKRWGSIALVVGAYLVAASGSVHADDKGQTARLAKARAMFVERCKSSGEFIHRTVENVDGVFLMKLRPKQMNYGDQFRMDDPYGRDMGGDGYLLSFLRGFETRQAQFPPGAPPRLGYRYIEAIDPADGKRYRYAGSVKEVTRKTSILMGGDGRTTFTTKEYSLDKVPAPGAAPRYGVTYDDLSTREEREYWIAGSSLKVIDLKTNEVIAERIGYMMDPGQGEKGGGRSPWLWAADTACPSFRPKGRATGDPGFSFQSHQTEDFVERVLKPRLEN